MSIFLIHVDDIVFGGSEKERTELLTSLQKKLPVKDLGRVHVVRRMCHRERR